MATLTIRNLPDEIRDQLRARAVANGHSMEAEARAALAAHYAPPAKPRSREDFLREVRKMQAAFAPYRRPGESLVDSLIADRRWEAACETAEEDGKPRPPRSAFAPGE